MRRKKWIVAKTDKDLAAQLAQELSLDPFAALLAASRGFETIEKTEEFFDPDAPLSLDPMSIKDMDKASIRINAAIDAFELICVFGDYDCDGVTATALLYSYLEARDANVIRYIPDRLGEGYGMSLESVRKLAEMGVKLIVTVDNGVSAIEETKLAKQLGMDVVVTDHHKVGDELPDAVAVVDPHREDCPSEFKEMSGVGVAFKLVCALEGGEEDMLLAEYGDLVALGTIGDVVALTDENRVMVSRGLRLINEDPRPGIYALMISAGIADKIFSASTAAYTVCPRINAAGRMGSADKALELLLSADDDSASLIADEISNMNALRQKTETDIFVQATSMLEKNADIKNQRVIVVDGEGWHQGVVGIVAARITEKYGRPSVVISRDGENARGSGRSIEGFSIYDAIESAADVLDHFGGHTLAAGVSLKSENIDEFRRRINEFAADKEMPFAIQRVDCRLNPESVSLDIVSAMAMLEPFGTGNPQPVFGLFGVRIDEINSLSEGKHVRITVSKGSSRINALWFGMPEKKFPYSKGSRVDLAVNLDRNIYNGEERVSVIIKAMRPSDTDEEKVLHGINLFEKLARSEKLTGSEAQALIPERALQVDVFRSIKQEPLRDEQCEELCIRLGDDGENIAVINTAVAVMLEMGVLETDADGRVTVPENPRKVDLEDSAIMKRLRSCI
ncbi:MAG: single-stranded-DNA-specific exonuclease RecJ [Clostridia bacterium]|nr:single-stranded-DNA-specific exonuclease RecJ [Clostridia bacterium]